MPRPMPVPPVARRVVKNGSKMRARLLGEMPAPSSLTSTVALPPALVVVIETSVAPCLAELSMRLASTIAAFSADIRRARSPPASTRTASLVSAGSSASAAPIEVLSPLGARFSALARSSSRRTSRLSRPASVTILFEKRRR